MAVPFGTPPDLAEYLDQIERRLAAVEAPGVPRQDFFCAQADLPSAATYVNCRLYVTDLKILAVSDGTNWRRQDTGAAI